MQERGSLRWGEEAVGLLALLQSSTLFGNFQTFGLEENAWGKHLITDRLKRKEATHLTGEKERAAVQDRCSGSACLVS